MQSAVAWAPLIPSGWLCVHAAEAWAAKDLRGNVHRDLVISIHFQSQDVPKVWGEGYVLQTDAATEEGGDLSGSMSCKAAAYTW